ncbi:TIGR03571 family LLM class oxidoreductase [Comamonas kerstersii]
MTEGINNALANHPGFNRVFGKGRLTMGFILPVEGYPNTATPTLSDHLAMTQLAEELGFAALWARDVPLLDPSFGDAGQMLDPYVYLGYLAGQTKKITLGTASTVLTLRHPIHTAKEAASVDFLSNGRVVLGVASGDRPVEYPAFGLEHEFESRGERFREAFTTIRAVTEGSFPEHTSSRFGSMSSHVDMLPKPVHGRLPMLVTGRSRQDLSWIAENADGWLFYNVRLEHLGDLLKEWNGAVQQAAGPDAFKP